MSRVDEALRRAAELAAGRQIVAEPGRDDSPDPASVDRPELRRVWPLPTEPTPPPSPAPSGRSTLFADLSVQGLGDGLASKVVIDREMEPTSREQYRRLAATLHQTQSATGLKVLLVVSAVAREGKTLTAANLAMTLSESYQRRVLLVDGDLRRPALDNLFRIDASPGLNEGLTSPVEQMMPVRAVTPRLMVLPAGAATADPIAGLTSDRMRRLIDEARGAFDWVIVDTPPVGALADASLLSSIADGAVLVINAGSTPCDLVQRAIDALGRDRILGIVLNRSQVPPASDYYSHYYAAAPAAGR
jgi:capsular exopolysaccharide synthesis family protein